MPIAAGNMVDFSKFFEVLLRSGEGNKYVVEKKAVAANVLFQGVGAERGACSQAAVSLDPVQRALHSLWLDQTYYLVRPYPPDRICIIGRGFFEIRADPAATSEAVEAHCGEVMPAPALFTVFSVVLVWMPGQP